VSDDELRAILEKAWKVGGLQFRANFKDVLTDERANAKVAQFVKDKIRSIVRDPDTAEKLADIDHPYAAKRPPIDSGYFEAFNRQNVALVDVRADPIERIERNSIRLTSGKEYELDTIIFATGFDAMTGPLLKLNISGVGGKTLTKEWQAGPKTYLGLQISGFPNMFTITGPGSPSVLCNMPVCIEQHVDWITDCIAYMRKKAFVRIDTTESAMHNWGREVQQVADATLLPRVPHSWYLGANIPGKPRVFMPYAGGMDRYRQICNDVADRDYEGFSLTQ
jgi:cation diffusion facilitator CzcD-associated flavoprotein CzcO